MNLLTLNGTATVALNRSPFVPTGNRNVVILNLSAASVQPRTSVDGGTTWVNWGAAVTTITAVERAIPQGVNAVSLAAPGAAFILASP